MFDGVFNGRRVLVTGNTGFKGSWLCHWLLNLGAEVAGLALPPDGDPALFTALRLGDYIDHRDVDIRDAAAVRRAVCSIAPQVVLHLAAQPIVRTSYADPKSTWDINVGGTVNLLEAVRSCPTVRACVVVSSDKCYENREWEWGYRESDAMGGHDPYSASKGATELVVSSYRRSYFRGAAACRLASARAGNVIGGGDWAADRIVADFVRACAAGEGLTLRNPHATRPWQHVLEPLSGYLTLAWHLLDENRREVAADGWNFGPSDASVTSVRELAEQLAEAWGGVVVRTVDNSSQPHEAGLLKLDVSKAATRLGWHGIWDVRRTVAETVAWYRCHHDGGDVVKLTKRQSEAYGLDAAEMRLPWAQNANKVSVAPLLRVA